MVNLYGFGDEAIAAFVVFILGVFFTIIWRRFTEKKRRLVYAINSRQIVLDVDGELRDRISILVDQHMVQTLYAYSIVVWNQGKLAVRNQQVLFEFPEKAQLITDPRIQHEPLMGPIKQVGESLFPLQLTYEIELLAKEKRVTFEFFTKENKTQAIKVYGRNEVDTETEFIEQSSQKLLNREEHAQRLLILLIAYLVAPRLLGFLIIGGGLGFQLVGVLQGVLLLFAYPSAKFLVNNWFRNKKEETVAEILLSNLTNSQVIIASQGGSIHEVEQEIREDPSLSDEMAENSNA